MSYGGDTADMLVHEGIQVTESAVKLVALGAKNLAALLLALAKKKGQSLSGVTDILKMLQDGTIAPAVITLNQEQLKQFTRAVKGFKLPYKPITDKTTGTTDIVFRESDMKLMLRVLERAGFAVPAQEETEKKAGEEKNQSPRAPSGNKSTGRGSGSKASAEHTADTDRTARPTGDEKPSVVSRVEAIKRAQADLDKERRAQPKAKTTPTRGAQR